MSDANFSTGRSISGNISFIANGPVSWMAKKQPVTSISTTEAEYYAASSCGQDILFLRHLLSDIGLPPTKPTTLYVDNSGTVDLSKHFESSTRTRHIDRRVHFLNDYQDMKELIVTHISTDRNISDIMTKPLARPKFELFTKGMGMFAAKLPL